jgi:hypothetical protein
MIKVGDRVKVYGNITPEYYAYSGIKGTVKSTTDSSLWVAFDGKDGRLSHCCNSDQVHRKQCRKLRKVKK